jgi:transposase
VKLVVRVKLLPTPEQASALEATLHACNEAANRLSAQAYDHQVTSRARLQAMAYGELKGRGLSAQPALHVLRKVADAYTTLKANLKAGNLGKPGSKRHTKATGKPITFRKDAAQPYDDRCLSWQTAERTVSIWTTTGRMKNLAFTGQGDQLAVLAAHRKGESDLLRRDGQWYLIATCDIPEAMANAHPAGFLGVDLGIVNIASTSTGTRHCGRRMNRHREADRKLRSRLQKKNTKSARRRARKHAGKEARRARDINHKISKSIVAEAERTARGIALEDLTGIRERARLRKPGGTSHALKAVGERHAALLVLPSARHLHRLQGPARRRPAGVRRPGEHQPGMLPLPPHRQTQPALPGRLHLQVLRLR